MTLKVSAVPHIEGLTVQDFLEYTKNKPAMLKYLPDTRDRVHIYKKWLCDVMYSLDSGGI